MANLVELVKQAALDAVSAAHPTQVVFGKVTALDPLEVRIHQQLLLTREFLVLSEGIRIKAAQGTLHAGDTLLLLQQQGGQSFLALDILPGADWELPPEEPVTWADIAEKPEVFPPCRAYAYGTGGWRGRSIAYTQRRGNRKWNAPPRARRHWRGNHCRCPRKSRYYPG